MGTTLCAAHSKSYGFSTNYHACMAKPTWCRCAPPILFCPWPPFNLFPRSCLTWIFVINLSWGIPLCVHRSVNTDFSTNYQACMAMPSWCRCASLILFWPWPPFNLFPRSCFSLSILAEGAAPSKSYNFSTNYFNPI